MNLRDRIELASSSIKPPKEMRCSFVELAALVEIIKGQDAAVKNADASVQKATQQLQMTALERDIARAERNELIVKFVRRH